MKIQSHNKFFAIAGLFFGLIGSLYGLHMSSATESTPALMGVVTAIWCAVSASIIGGRVNKSSAS